MKKTSTSTKVRQYLSLTKPGVLFGNVLTAAAGFLLASTDNIEVSALVGAVVGMTLVIGAACALNNYFDRDIDQIMERTKGRAVASGAVNGRGAVIFSLLLLAASLAVLAVYTNWLTFWLAAAGFIVYVFFYGMLAKRLSVHGTLVGSVSGAVPILAGYTAAAGRIDAGAILAFAALFCWQLPEFYSIAIYRKKEYQAAGIPVISVVRGVKRTKIEILAYTAAFVAATLLLVPFGHTGAVYLIVMAAAGAYWLRLGIRGLRATNNDRWARQMFHASLNVLLLYCLMIAIGPHLP